MAAEWGVPPWRIEAEASATWADRWMALRVARNEKAKRDTAKPAKGRRLM